MGREQRISQAEQRSIGEQVGVPIGKDVVTMGLTDLRRASLRNVAGEWVPRSDYRAAMDSLGACYVALAQAHVDLEAAASELTMREENVLASSLLRISARTWNALPYDWPGKATLKPIIAHDCDPDHPCDQCREDLTARALDRAVDEARDGR